MVGKLLRTDTLHNSAMDRKNSMTDQVTRNNHYVPQRY